jgi:hypothetical protein
MLQLQHVILSIDEVPETWVYEQYCGLDEPLIEGKTARMKSLFNAGDNEPSMFIFFATDIQKWRWNDFSTGKKGNHVQLVRYLLEQQYGHSFSYGLTIQYIIQDYQKYLSSGGCVKPITPKAENATVSSKYEVSAYQVRSWNSLDIQFWSKPKISSATLDRFNVRPLSYYVMVNKNKYEDYFAVSEQAGLIYGYFTKNGELYKIYSPGKSQGKFIKIFDYLQGYDQLNPEINKSCLIMASLKDGMAMSELNLGIDFVAPHSETTLLGEPVIIGLKQRYNNRVFTLLDTDAAGLQAMEKYRSELNVLPIIFKPPVPNDQFKIKDMAECTEKIKRSICRKELLNQLHKTMNINLQINHFIVDL